jgi:hypothetical protein
MRRALSWLIGGLAYVGPPVWAFFAIRADSEALVRHVFVCGNSRPEILTMGAIASAALSFIAVLLGSVSFDGLPKPRSVARRFELGVLPLPCVVIAAYFASRELA